MNELQLVDSTNYVERYSIASSKGMIRFMSHIRNLIQIFTQASLICFVNVATATL